MTPHSFTLAAPFASASPFDACFVFLLAIPLVIFAAAGILASVVKSVHRSSIRRRSLGTSELMSVVSGVEAESAKALEETLIRLRGETGRSSRASRTLDTENAIEAAETRKEYAVATAIALFVRGRAKAFSRRTNMVAGFVALAASALSLVAIIPFVAEAADENNATVATWESDRSVWALEKYGVTAGMNDLVETSTGLFDILYVQPFEGRVIAQGAIVDVTLEFIGDQPVLLLDGEVNSELPLVGETPAESDTVEVTE